MNLLTELYSGATIDHFEYNQDERLPADLNGLVKIHFTDGRVLEISSSEWLMALSPEVDAAHFSAQEKNKQERHNKTLQQIREDELRGLI